MLVNEDIVKNWYKPSSPIYKLFAYLFQNPLWNKPIPRGSTVCPYFWRAMFSLFIFIPFVFVITKIITPILKVLWWIFSPIDWIGKAFWNVLGLNTSDFHKGQSIILAFLSLVCITGIGIAGWFLGSLMYTYIILGSAVTNWTFWSFIALGAMLIGLFIHYKAAGARRCPSYVYIYVYTALLIATGLYFIPTAFLAGAWLIAALLWSFVATIGTAIWMAFYFLWLGISEAFKFVAAGLPMFITVMAIYLGIMWYMVSRLFRSDADVAERDLSEEWLDYLVAVFRAHHTTRALIAMSSHYRLSSLDRPWNRLCISALMDRIHREKLINLAQRLAAQEVLPTIPVSVVQEQDESGDVEREAIELIRSLKEQYPKLQTIIEEEWLVLSANDTKVYGIFVRGDMDDWMQTKAAQDIYQGYAEEVRKDDAKKSAKREKWQRFWAKMHTACLTVTSPLHAARTKVATKVSAGAKKVGIPLATFVTYLIILGKSWKNNACPYFRFEDEEPPDVGPSDE